MAKITIIDGNSLLFRAYFATAYPGVEIMRNKEGIPTNAIFAFSNMINKILADLKEDERIMVAFDAGKQTFRKEQLESYKANRKPTPEDLVTQFPIARDFLRALGIFQFEEEGFEGDRRDSITAELDEQLAHSKLCKIHGLYYFDRYTDCPLCSGVAKLKPVIQVITTVPTAAGPKVVVVFADPNVRLMLDQNTYFDNSGNIVYLPTKKSFPRLPNARMHFASGGRYLVSMLPAKMQVKDGDGNDIANIERMMNSSYAVEGANVLYVDTGDVLHKMLLSSIGLQDQALFQASNPLLSLNELGEYFVVNRYHDRIMVSYKNHDVEIMVKPKFKEYVIKYDAVTKTWLFIYEEASGAFRTMIFGENGKEYDDNVVRYSATPLSNVAYRNGTVYDPGIKSFTGTNLKKGTSKIFQCDAVDETCMLKLEGNSFIIVGDTSVSRFG